MNSCGPLWRGYQKPSTSKMNTSSSYTNRLFYIDNQGQWGQTSSMSVHSIFAEWGVQITRSWKEEGFGYLDHKILMCENMGLSTSMSESLECAGSLKGKNVRYNHTSENEGQIVGSNPNDIFQLCLLG